MDVLDKLKEYLDNPENQKKAREYFANIESSERRLLERGRKLISSLSEEEFKVLLERLFIWEEKYEDRWYKKGVQTTSVLFDTICKIASEDGPVNFDNMEESNFMTNRVLYKGFIFEVFVGQGCFYRIYELTNPSFRFTSS